MWSLPKLPAISSCAGVVRPVSRPSIAMCAPSGSLVISTACWLVNQVQALAASRGSSKSDRQRMVHMVSARGAGFAKAHAMRAFFGRSAGALGLARIPNRRLLPGRGSGSIVPSIQRRSGGQPAVREAFLEPGQRLPRRLMFTLHAAFGPVLPGYRGPFFLPAAAAVCLSAALAIGQAPVAQVPAPAAKPQDSKPQPAAAAPKLGRVVADSVALRCWPGNVAAPPVYEDVLPKDHIVSLGRSENGFRAVIVPLGPIGYVSRKYAVASPEGKVTTKGAKVAFRYRPRTTEAPVTQL